METFNVSAPLTSVVQENAATMFCCESPGMFSGTTNFHQHEGEQKMMNCHCYVNSSFHARARERLVCSRAVLKMHHCYIFGFVPHRENTRNTNNSRAFCLLYQNWCSQTFLQRRHSTVGYNESCINLPI